MFVMGVYSIRRVNIHADYRKWLGPDWKPRTNRYGIQVSNHQCYLDIFVQFCLDNLVCGFLQRNGSRKVPFIGLISEVIGGVFVKRGGDKAQRLKAMEMIAQRQIEAE